MNRTPTPAQHADTLWSARRAGRTLDAEETLETTRALGISFVAYSPLGRSLLTGAVRQATDIPEGDGRSRHPRFAGHNLARNLEMVAAIEAVHAAAPPTDITLRAGATFSGGTVLPTGSIRLTEGGQISALNPHVDHLRPIFTRLPVQVLLDLAHRCAALGIEQ